MEKRYREREVAVRAVLYYGGACMVGVGAALALLGFVWCVVAVAIGLAMVADAVL